jgi:hypothetical protein
MTRRLENVVSLGGPFRGLDLDSPADMIHPFSAVTAKNVITSHGSIDVRDPILPFFTGTLMDGDLMDSITQVTSPLAFETNISSADVSHRVAFFYYVGMVGTTVSARAVLIADNASALAFPIPYDTVRPVFANDVLYVFAYGTPSGSRKYYINAGGNWTSATIGQAKPTIGVGVLGGGTLAAGTYYYRATFVNSETEAESEYSSPDGETVPLNSKIRVSWSAATDSQSDRVRIYRYVVGVDDTYYRIVELPENTTGRYWDDDGSVSPTKLYTERLKTGAAAPPPLTFAAWHKGYMWWVPESNEGTIRHSLFGEPELGIATNSYSCGDNDASPIMAARSVGDVLLIFKRDSLWAISGDSEESFICSRIASGNGCIAPLSLCETDEALYWMGDRGVYRWYNGAPALISRSITPLLSARTFSELKGTTIAWDSHHHVVIVNVPTTSEHRQFVYHPETDSWTTWNIPAWCVLSFRSEADALTRAYFALYGSPGDAGDVGRLSLTASDGMDYGTQAIVAEWKTGDLTLGTRRRKKFYYARLAWNASESTDKVTLAADVGDDEGIAGISESPADFPKDIQLRVAGVGDTLALSASVNATARLKLTALDIDADLVGYR